MDIARAQLEQARNELLYLGLRNPLINYRHLRARGVEMVDETPTHVYNVLVEKEKEMSFLPVTDPLADDASVLSEVEKLLAQPKEVRQKDLYLQTAYDTAVLQKRLHNSYYIARSYIEEQGVNILYLALGMLHWYERESSEKLRRAPLVLIPVALRRARAHVPFHLAYTGTEIGSNLSLQLKMKLDYGLELPALAEGESLNLPDYFAAVADAISPQQRWQVDETAVSLGFFSFSKFLMYNDLDPVSWPDGATQPHQHPILSTLLGNGNFADVELASSRLDEQIDLAHSHQVVEADSSQTEAILAVNKGHNLVIQGPPGTGKSQTITNLIAEGMGQGKTVLFVSEKMAALDVVKRRLDEVGLGDAALTLHSHKTTKRSFLDELGQAWQLGQPKEDGRFPQLPDLQEAQRQLNGYHCAMNQPVGDSGLTAFYVYGRSLQLQQKLAHLDLPDFDNQQMRQWSRTQFDDALKWVADVEEQLKVTGIPEKHAFWRCGHLQSPIPNLQSLIDQIRSDSLVAQQALTALQTAVSQLADQLHIPAPESLTEIAELHDIGQQLLSAPNLFATDVHAEAWLMQADDILVAIEAGQQIQSLQDEFAEWLIPEAWTQDVLAIRTGIIAGKSRLSRWFLGEYRAAKRQLAGLCQTAVPDDWQTQIDLVDGILEAQRWRPKLDTMNSTLAQLFGIRWEGDESDWGRLLTVALWLTRLHKEIGAGKRPSTLLGYLEQKIDKLVVEQALVDIEEQQAGYETAVYQLQQLLQHDGQSFIQNPFAAQGHQLQRYHNEAERYPEMVAHNQIISQSPISNSPNLIPIAHSWPHAAQHLTTFFEYRYYVGLVEKAQAERPFLLENNQSETVAQFSQLDGQFLEENRIRLMQAEWQKLSRHTGTGQAGNLQREIEKKNQHKPIRQLMREAGTAIQKIKPIFMMSPLSIAMFLPTDSVMFDLVIFDEASQVRPVDAFGAILRGKQVVVVGDNRQLPPTMFFESVTGENETSELESENWYNEESNLQSAISSFQAAESILDLFIAKNAPQRMLRWHYRSRHESLIVVSNREFYERQLVVFPSPDEAKAEVGLVYHHLPHTAYDRGGTRTNVAEARVVAQAAISHAQRQPHLTLGIAAFSSSQREAVQNELELLRQQADEQTEAFFNAHPIEPFFVKNLENVQGDERDVMLISVGYGRSADGRLTMNFGPLNQRGGERRLNVLITRARRRCEIFTNLTAADIDLNRTEALGVAGLKTYLHYAQTGELDELAPAWRQDDNPLLDLVAGQLEARGFGVERPFNEMIDLAVRDPQQPNRFLLGIQLDGNRPPSARDRERIQPLVLRGLGWRFYRLWGNRWWVNGSAELEKLIAVIETPSEQQPTKLDVSFALERYGERPFENRTVPDYAQANLTIDLKGLERKRGIWKLERSNNRYTCSSKSSTGYTFDVKQNRFVKVESWSGNYLLQASLSYYFKDHRFTFANQFELTFNQKKFKVFYDFQNKKFYRGLGPNKNTRRWKGPFDVFDPLEERWRKEDEQPSVRPHSYHMYPTQVSEEVTAEVQLEAVWVAQIVSVESPIHREVLEKRLATAVGLTRRTSTTEKLVDLAISMEASRENGRFYQKGDFFYANGQTKFPARYRANLKGNLRNMDYVADEEIETAVLLVVEDSIKMMLGKVAGDVGALLGVKSTRQAVWDRIYHIVRGMIWDGRLVESDEQYFWSKSYPDDRPAKATMVTLPQE